MTPSEKLVEFIKAHPKLTVLTGAGISTDSGIPAYRNAQGQWQQSKPMQHQDFINHEATRQRYWARSLIGWPTIRDAQPSIGHIALSRIEALGYVKQIITQNVDSLHQQAGSQRVVDLHGRADQVKCMACDQRYSRDDIHQRSARDNPAFAQLRAAPAPDGDAKLEGVDFSLFNVPHCSCGGILKPDVVYFGDNVPKERVQSALDQLQQSDALLTIGTSLMVYSGFRFCKRAHAWGLPIAGLTMGTTRADELFSLKLSADVSSTLAQAAEKLA